jgi:hypothetical protein
MTPNTAGAEPDDPVATLATVTELAAQRSEHQKRGLELERAWQRAIRIALLAGNPQRRTANAAGVSRTRIQQIEKIPFEQILGLSRADR